MLSRIARFLKEHYEKLILLAIIAGLVYVLFRLAGQVGTLSKLSTEMNRRIERLRPQYPEVAPVDRTLFMETMGRIENPPFFGSETNWFFVPEKRVWCVDCKRPIPWSIAEQQGVCPFCRAKQPLDVGEGPMDDTDKDGIPDQYEITHGLNRYDPSDALKDNDGDGFNNLTEYRAGTDPNDPKSFPPVEGLIFVKKIIADPFKLRFMGAVKGPKNERVFQINIRDLTKTYFTRLGEKVEGFLVAKYEEKFEKRIIPGSTVPVDYDVSELTLEKEDKKIVLVKGADVMHHEYFAEIVFSLDNSTYKVRVGESFSVKGNNYCVINIDSTKEIVRIQRMSDKKEFDIKQIQQTEQEKEKVELMEKTLKGGKTP
jgi:hypothetical protein